MPKNVGDADDGEHGGGGDADDSAGGEDGVAASLLLDKVAAPNAIVDFLLKHKCFKDLARLSIVCAELHTAVAVRGDVGERLFKFMQQLCAKNWQAMSLHGESHVAIVDNGKLKTSGMGPDGQLGRSLSLGYQRMPHVAPIDPQHTIVAVATGERHTTVLTDDGNVFACGSDDDGQLGFYCGTSINYLKRVEALNGKRIVHIASQENSAAAISYTGATYIWGAVLKEPRRALHDDDAEGNPASPVHPLPALQEALPAAVQVSVTDNAVAIVTQDGAVWEHSAVRRMCYSGARVWRQFWWGRRGTNAVRVALTVYGAMAILTRAGEVYARPDCAVKHRLTLVKLPHPAQKLVAGDNHFVVLLMSGDVFGWGNNINGQLGRNDARCKTYPVCIATADVQATDVTAGFMRTGIVTEKGVCACGKGLLMHRPPIRDLTPPRPGKNWPLTGTW